MIFGSLPAGEPVFLDANILVYHFTPHPIFGPACNQLVQRIENQELLGFTSSGLLSNDALIVGVMQANGLTNLASNDPDFDRVAGIHRYAPV